MQRPYHQTSFPAPSLAPASRSAEDCKNTDDRRSLVARRATKNFRLPVAGLLAASLLAAHAAPLLAPGDKIFAYDLDTAGGSTGSVNFLAVTYTAGQEPNLVLDGDRNTKHLNRSKWNAGIIVTGFTPAAAQSMVITTANDAQERDPSSYIILGSNHPITSADKSNGFADHWTFIAQGSLSLPAARLTAGTPVNFTNSTSYSAYWIVFPTTKDTIGNSLMQISELQLHTGPGATGSTVFNPSDTALCTGWNSSVATGEFVARVIDGNPATKYLNFGENNSGFFVVPSAGPTVIDSFQLTTANDSEARDPASWQLHGMALDGQWSLIDSGTLSLPAARTTAGPVVPVANTNVYLAYRMTFPTVKTATSANSMQVAEAQFFGTIVPRVDTDSDGMDDDWETLYGLIVGVDDSAGDLDSDGLTNAQEFQSRTLPNNSDTDGDGLFDGVETRTGIFVSASDTGTDPLKADTDGDTYRDGYEVARGTDPNNAASVPTITWDITPGTVGTGDNLVTGGAGTWNLTNGNWTINNGSDNIAWDNAGNRLAAIFGGTAGMVTVEAPIHADRVIVNTAGYNFSGGTLTLSGPDPRISIASGTTEMSMELTGSAGFSKLGNGVLRLSGSSSNTYTGTTYLGDIGKLVLAKAPGEIAVPGDIYLNSSAFNGNNSGVVLAGNEQIADGAVLTWAGLADTYFRLNGFTETISGLASDGNGNFAVIENRGLNDTATYDPGTLVLNIPGTSSHSFGGQIRNMDGGTGGGTVAITKTGTGTQILSGNMSYSGATTVNGGELRINGALTGSSATVTGSGILTGTGTISLPVNVQADGTLSPGIAGNGALTTNGGVTFTAGGNLAGGGTLAGAVTVGSGGVIAGTGSVTGTVTVQSGGILAGTATLNNAVTLQVGSTLAPGGSEIGTLTATGSVNLAGQADFTIHKDGANLSSDLLAGFTAITYGGDLTVTATGDTLAVGDSFQLFAPANGATIAGGFASITLPTLPTGQSWEATSLLTTGTITVVDYVSKPTFSPAGGGYIGQQLVTLASAEGATIYYTTDGTEPTLLSTSGLSPVTGIVVPTDSIVTIKAFAAKSGWANSPVVTAVFGTVTTPAWNVDADGLWSDTDKWLNAVSPDATDAPVLFTFAQTANATVTLDASRTVGSLTFGSPNDTTWTITTSNASILTLATTSGTPSIEVQNSTATIAAGISGTQGLLKSGAGTLVCGTVNTYGGDTTVNGGVLSVASLTPNGTPDGLGTGANLILNGGTLRYTGANVPFGNFARTINLGTAGGTLDAAIGGFWFTSGVISGDGALTKTGAGQLIVQAANTYTGVTTIQQAEVQIRTLDSLGSTAGHTVVNDGGRLCAGGALVGTINENLTLNGLGGNNSGALQANDGGTNVTYAGAIELATDSGIGSTGTIAFAISGPISGNGGLIKLSANSVTLAGAAGNSYLGATTLGGTGRLVLAKTGGAIALPGDVFLSSTAWNGNASGVVLGGNEQIADTAVITWTTTAFGGGTQSDSFLRLNGFSETVGGLVSVGDGTKAVIENRGLGDIATYGTATLTIRTAGTNSYSYNGSFRDQDGGTGGGNIALVKAGTGTQILNGTIASTGATSVQEGTLVINATSAAVSTTVASDATLKGTGVLTGPLTVSTGGTIAPGQSVGTFSAGDTVITGTYQCEIDGASTDRLTVNGSLDITGATLQFETISPPTAASYVLASYTTTLTGTFTVTGLPASYTVQYDAAAKQIKLVNLSFAGWAAGKGLSGDPSADFDQDGLPDAVEYVLGSDPTAASAGGPAASTENGDFVFTFERDHASKTADIALAIEVGTTLAAWPLVYQVGTDTASSTPGVTVIPHGTYDTVTLRLTRAPDAAKFARLRVTVSQ